MLNVSFSHLPISPYGPNHCKYHTNTALFEYLMIFDGTAQYLLMIKSLAEFYDSHMLSLWTLLRKSLKLFQRTMFWMTHLIGFCQVNFHYQNMKTANSFFKHIGPYLLPKWIAFYPKESEPFLKKLFQIQRILEAISKYRLG